MITHRAFVPRPKHAAYKGMARTAKNPAGDMTNPALRAS